MAIDPKKQVALREEIRKKIKEGLKSSQIVALGYDSEMVRDVKAEENNLRDKNLRNEEQEEQKRSQSAKRERQYRATMIELGQDPDKITLNSVDENLPVEKVQDSTVQAPALESNVGEQSNAGAESKPA